jgi:hypothetical protein
MSSPASKESAMILDYDQCRQGSVNAVIMHRYRYISLEPACDMTRST